jgi:CDP-diacylglycerol--glycerol-3-phosphate 3-phosphatidyltransferase
MITRPLPTLRADPRDEAYMSSAVRRRPLPTTFGVIRRGTPCGAGPCLAGGVNDLVVTRQEPWATWANLVTAIRLVVGLAIFAHAAVTRSEGWNLIGLGVYWALDVVDGFLARRLDQETRIGAQMDILADRVLVAFFYLNYVVLYPELVLPISMFLFQFMAIDHYLSIQFMRWPIMSPNYFYKVDRTIWALNWSPIAKAINTAVVTGVLVISKSPVLGAIACGAIIVLKIWTAVRMYRLPPPEAHWIAP